MTTDSISKPPVWFWVVSVIALLWNLMGVSAYLADAYTSVEQLEQMSQEIRELYEGRPAWATAGFAIAVFAGAIGSIALLLRKKWARPLLILSVLGSIILNIHTFFLSNALEVMGANIVIMPIVVIVFGIYLIFFAKKGIQKGWLS
ncbi:hypothetical protein FVB32_00035 [Flagellimonas hymeniacidonis]|uniref:Sugar transporter n=1 Tax=Flagellimonas hymeniacidonis TaxID=2603628 RepID=A0A5C8V3R3_9FLAO|nr:hypothetical protein [Flagellimonas hymeniacidonis]TXN36714.1 hypothetical protein FVB32_00035 [Flagellimonas hymeniacidonis]